MDRAWYPPWIGIKANGPRIVKAPSAALLTAVLCAISAPRAVDAAIRVQPGFSLHDTDSFPIPVRDEELPNIEARSFEVRPLRTAESKRTYLFEDASAAKPRVGSILLLKFGEEPVMAFRVLRTYAQNRQFIARRVRRYHKHEMLEENQSYTALERVSEIPVPGHMSYTTEEERDINELQQGMDLGAAAWRNEAQGFSRGDFYRSDELPSQLREAELERHREQGNLDEELDGGGDDRNPQGEGLPDTDDYDPELDAGTSPPPRSGPPDNDEFEGPAIQRAVRRPWRGDDDDDSGPTSIEEADPIDRDHHALTMQLGFLHNLNSEEKPVYFTGIGLRYGLTLGRMLLLSRPKLQDSLTLEGSAFLYKIANYTQDDDAYTVMPLIGTVRYTVMTSDHFGFFFYGGIGKNLVTPTAFPENADADALTQGEAVEILTRPVTAAGAGLLFKLGPGWEIRADVGLDMIATGLMLRF